MTSKEFILWLKGFTQGIEEYTITPTPIQWNVIKDKLSEVNDDPIGVPIGEGGMGVPNTQPFPRWQEPHILNVPHLTPNVEIPCVNPNGTVPSPHFVIPSTPGITFSTTPGSGIGTITTPNGTLAYDPSTTTRWNPSGSNWSYTSTQKEPTQTSERQLLTDNID
jgi:hypothetical protein